jgi:hypothetical protein
MALRYYIYLFTTTRLFFRLPGEGVGASHCLLADTSPSPARGTIAPLPSTRGLPNCLCLLSLTSTLCRGVKTPVYTGYTGTIHQYAQE